MFLSVCRAAGFAVLVTSAVTQARELLRPAELPPPSYRGQQYVDSKGCLFLRAGTAAAVVWIPRVTRQGGPVCGFPPSGHRVPVDGEAGNAAPAGPGAPGTAEMMVAVGIFPAGREANRAARSMADLGLPVTRGQVVQNGIVMASVFAGPFKTQAAADQALQLVRQAGFLKAALVGQ